MREIQECVDVILNRMIYERLNMERKQKNVWVCGTAASHWNGNYNRRKIITTLKENEIRILAFYFQHEDEDDVFEKLDLSIDHLQELIEKINKIKLSMPGAHKRNVW